MSRDYRRPLAAYAFVSVLAIAVLTFQVRSLGEEASLDFTADQIMSALAIGPMDHVVTDPEVEQGELLARVSTEVLDAVPTAMAEQVEAGSGPVAGPAGDATARAGVGSSDVARTAPSMTSRDTRNGRRPNSSSTSSRGHATAHGHGVRGQGKAVGHLKLRRHGKAVGNRNGVSDRKARVHHDVRSHVRSLGHRTGVRPGKALGHRTGVRHGKARGHGKAWGHQRRWRGRGY